MKKVNWRMKKITKANKYIKTKRIIRLYRLKMKKKAKKIYVNKKVCEKIRNLRENLNKK